MEFRVLQYFLAVTREQSISGAAEALHLSQPNDKENILNRDFKADTINQKWCTDITYIHVLKEG